MKQLSNILLLLLLVHSTQSNPLDECAWWNKAIIAFQCRTASNEFEVIQESREFTESKNLGRIAKLIKDVIDCLAPYPCAETVVQELLPMYEHAMYEENDNQLCLKGFFEKAYQGQFSKEQSCYREHSFLDSNENKRRDAFTNGKLCFMKYLRENCMPATVEYFSSENYQKFIESMSTPSFSCSSSQDFLYKLRCGAILSEYNSRVDPMNNLQEKAGNPFVADTLKTCRDVQSCGTNSCVLIQIKWPRAEFERNCEEIKRSYLG